jgi:hypothetical protein
MNDTMTTPDARDEELGRRVGRALDRRQAGPMAIELGAVRQGARRRRARRHVMAGVASVAVVVAGVAVIVRRHAETVPADSPPSSVPATPVIPAVAVLPASFGEPVFAYASQGGQPRGAALPRVDVWQSGSTRVVVRTFSDPAAVGGPSTTFEAPATTAAEERRTDPGTIEQLASDQWVRYLSPQRERGDNVIVRGLDQNAAEALFASLVDVGGALTPPVGYDLVEHADASAAEAPAGWYAMVGYGKGAGDRWVVTSPLMPDRPSLELAMSFAVGSVRDIGGRQVFVEKPAEDRVPALTWLDPSGVVIGYTSRTTADESVVGQASLVSQHQLEDIARRVSSGLAAKPVLASTDLDGVTLTLRGTRDGVAACVADDAAEQCAEDLNASVNQPPMAGTMHALVEGQWVIWGYYELGVDGYDTPDPTDDQFLTPEGERLPIVTGDDDGFLWYVIRVPSGDATVTTSYTNDVGGVVGTIARPIVVSTFG